MKSFTTQGIALAVTLALLSSASRAHADPVSDWNAIANVVLLKTGRPAGANIVDMVYVHIAMYDAVNAIDGKYTPFAVRPSNAAPWASEDAAIAAAAYTVLVRFYPDQGLYLDSVYAHALVDVPNNDAKTRGIAIGTEVAERFLALRADDGRNAVIPYTFGSGPGVYQLTPGAPPPPATPQTPWIAHLKPFAMVSDSQFRAPAPPEITSEIYTRDFNESKQYGVRDNSARTPQQTATGQFYLDNPATQLGRNLRLIDSSRNMSVAEIARFFAQMYVTIGDAVIAAWDSKFHYNFWRPVTAIRAADTDGNPNTEPDTAWLPLGITPGHPEYPAAHGYVTGGLAYGLERYFGTSALDITLTSASVPGSPMTYHTYASTDSIVREVINARVYGGMHYRNSVEVGAAIAQKVADWVADHFFKPSEAPVPTANLQLWLQADSGLILNGPKVSTWKDLSGNGNDALQPDTSRQPLLVKDAVYGGKPALMFDGVNDRLGFTGTTRMSQFSIFIVEEIDSGAADNHYYYPITLGDSAQTYGLSMRNGFSNNSPDEIDPYLSENSWVRAVAPGSGCAAFGKWKLICVTANQNMWNTTMHVNGVAATITPQGGVNTPLSVPLGTATVSEYGGLGMTKGNPLAYLIARCHVAEVLVYGSALTDSARQAVETYLATKYGLSQPSIPNAGLQLWLKADAGVDTLNGSVSRWHDQSGHGNDAIQADMARQPLLVAGALNGKPVLRFDGANDRVGLTGTTPMHQISMFLVFKVESGATGLHPYYPVTLGDTYHDGQIYGLSMRNDFSGNSPDIIDPFAGTSSWLHATLPGIAAFGEWKVLSITTDKLMYSTSLRVGGKEAVDSPQTSTNMAISVPLGSADGLGVGGIGGADHLDVDFVSAIFKGDIAEVIVYDTVLAEADRQAVENYLISKYTITSVAQLPLGALPQVTRLEQNYPNPFNPSTSIQFQLSAPSHVTLKVFDLLGREVATLVDENKPVGVHSVRFDGGRLASGVYFFRLQAGSLVQTRKMILAK